MIYEVTARRRFRGHPPGTRFEATLAAAVEQRALARGDIRVVDDTPPTLRPGSYRLPDGWAIQQRRKKEEV